MRAPPSLLASTTLATLMLAPIPAVSAVMTVGCVNANASCTLDELAQGATISAGDKVFSGWSVGDFSTVPVSLAGIEVIGLDDGGDPGIRFQADTALSSDGFDLIDLEVRYLASASDPAMRVVGGTVELEAFEFPASNAGGFAALFVDANAIGGGLLDTVALTADNFPPPAFLLSGSWSFASQQSVEVVTNIIVGGDDFTDTATLNAFSQRLIQVAVPAPPVFGLLLGALLVLGLARSGRGD